MLASDNIANIAISEIGDAATAREAFDRAVKICRTPEATSIEISLLCLEKNHNQARAVLAAARLNAAERKSQEQLIRFFEFRELIEKGEFRAGQERARAELGQGRLAASLRSRYLEEIRAQHRRLQGLRDELNDERALQSFREAFRDFLDPGRKVR